MEENVSGALPVKDFLQKPDLKGSVDYEEDKIIWNLGDVSLELTVYPEFTAVEYYHKKGVLARDGNFREDTSEMLKLLEKINDENNTVKISFYPFVSSFDVIDKTEKKKNSWLFAHHYYSC